MQVINAAYKTQEKIIKTALDKTLVRMRAKAKYNKKIRNRKRVKK